MYKFLLIATVAIACAHAQSDPNDVHAVVVNQRSDIHEDGSYQYEYQTSNGISGQEAGVGGHQANGAYSYHSPEGQLVQVSYVADDNGFQPQSDVLPTPPPIPVEILKALEYIRTHPQYVEPQHNQFQGRKF